MMQNDDLNLFKKVLSDIKYRKERIEKGLINTIPYRYKRLNNFIPGIHQECQIGLTTITGGGKTQFSMGTYVKDPYTFWLKNKELMDIDVRINYFCLEDSKEITTKRMIVSSLYDHYGIRLGVKQLDSYFEDKKLDDDTLRKIESLEEYFEIFFTKVGFYDNNSNATGIFKTVEEWLLQNGNITDEKGNVLNEREIKDRREAFQHLEYRPKNTNTFVINIVDNMQNVTTEKGSPTKWEACDKLSRIYFRNKLCNFYKCFNLIIAQQSKEKETLQFNSSGGVIEERFKPSLGDIAEYRNVTDTCHYMLGLFDPYRYNIERYVPNPSKPTQFYDINRLESMYRQLIVLKSNFVEPNLNTSLFFDGLSGKIEELPRTWEVENLEVFYRLADELMNSNGKVALSTLTKQVWNK